MEECSVFWHFYDYVLHESPHSISKVKLDILIGNIRITLVLFGFIWLLINTIWIFLQDHSISYHVDSTTWISFQDITSVKLKFVLMTV